MKMRYIAILICFFMFGCSHKKTNINEQTYCTSSFYNDSLLVSKDADSSIKVENYHNNEAFKIISKTKYCLAPIVSNNNLYYLKNDSIVEYIDLKSKKNIGQFRASNEINNIKAFDNFLVLNVKEEGVKLLKLSTLEPVMTIRKIEEAYCTDMLVNDFITEGNNIFISDFNCNNVYCVDIRNNNVNWTYKSDFTATRILMCDTILFCGLTGDPRKKEGSVMLFNTVDGKILFEKNELFDLIVKPIRYNNDIFFVTYDGKIKKLDLLSKKIITVVNLDSLQGICGNQLYIQDKTIYFSNCNNDIYHYNIETNRCSLFKKSESRLINVFRYDNKIHLKTNQEK